jgi:hypothetical protein
MKSIRVFVTAILSRLYLAGSKALQAIRSVPAVLRDMRELFAIHQQARLDVDALFDLDYPTLLAKRPDLAASVRSVAQRKALERWQVSSSTSLH